MDDMTPFEQRFEDRVRAFARAGVRPVDAAAVAHAVAVGQPRDRRAGSTVRWHGFRLDRRAWPLVVALGLLMALLGGALVVGARLLLQPPVEVSPAIINGWIAFTVSQPAPDSQGDDLDIWLAALEEPARRVVGTDTDSVAQLCPAFSPDGRSLAYGRVEGRGTEYDVDGIAEPAAYRNAALVVAEVADNGTVADRLTIDVGDGLPPPCPVWSPDGEQVAFGVNRTSPVNPGTSAAGSEVRIVTLADGSTTVLPDLLATDLEWSPDGSFLAIASGADELARGEALGDGLIHLFDRASGAMRLIEATSGAIEFAWSPDGRSIAYTGVDRTGADDQRKLLVVDAETGRRRALTPGYGILHGIGPVWSPDGETIAYQRGIGGEHSEVVLVTPGDWSDESALPREAVVPVTARGYSERLDAYRVTWSPDGQYLLMMAWGNGGSASLVAIPADLDGPPVVVAQGGGMVPYDGYPDTTLVPIQTWGRSPDPSPTPRPSVAAPTSGAENLVNRFLGARVAGEGAGAFVNDPDEDIPLLYATTSGASYERAEFERVSGIEWPYGWTAFRVRLFAGDTVVEQLFFTSSDNPVGLEYVPDGFGTDIAPATEDVKPVGAPYSAFDGEVTLQVAHPWVSIGGTGSIKLIPEGPRVPTTDGGERRGWISLVVMADPARRGASCPTTSSPADARALAESIRSDPGLEATAPASVGVRGADGLVMDVAIAAGSDRGDPDCRRISGTTGGRPALVGGVYLSAGERMRLYLFDAPEGLSMRTLAIAVVVPESQFERAAHALDAVEFHVP